jgi:hypothetical protein
MAACMGPFVITIQLVRFGKSLTKQKEIYLLAMYGDVNLINFTTYTVRSKGSRTEFFTAFLPTTSNGLRFNHVVETVSHKSVHWP